MQLTKNEYVLVVDDQDSARELLAVQLLHFDYPTRVARDGEEALCEVNQHPGVVAVLSDIDMPVLSGVGLLQRLKELDETIQVIMVSGVHDLDTVRECLREGAYDYLIKPYQMADLESVLQRAIDKTRLLRECQTYRLHLEEMVEQKTHELRQTRDIALITLAKLAESRDNETGLHLERISAYSLILGLRLRDSPYADLVTAEFLHDLERSARHRQSRNSRFHPSQGGSAERRRVRDHENTHPDRWQHPAGRDRAIRRSHVHDDGHGDCLQSS